MRGGGQGFDAIVVQCAGGEVEVAQLRHARASRQQGSAGGTKTVAAVAQDGKELARETGPAGTVRPGRVLASATAIASTVRQALARVGKVRADKMVVGAAGVGRDEERKALHAALRAEGIATTVHITTDIEIALEAAYGKGPGIVLLAGTGSFAIARLADGTLKREDFVAERKAIKDGLKLDYSEVEKYARKVTRAIDLVRKKYVKEITAGEWAAFAVNGLYRGIDEPVPEDVVPGVPEF